MNRRKSSWYIVVLIVTILTIALGYYFTNNWKISLILGIISGIITLIYNPITRYMRAFWTVFSALISLNTLSISFFLSFSSDKTNGFLNTSIGDKSIALTISLAVICCILLYLDFRERSGKNKSKNIQKVYNIQGDYVKGDKNVTNEEKPQKISPEPLIDIGNLNGRPNPYFKYKNNNLDFQFALNSVGDTVAHISQTTFTMVKVDSSENPLDFKIFRMRDLPDDYLIYKGKILYFGQQAGNLPIELLNNLFIVLDVIYTNESKELKKSLRRIYRINAQLEMKSLPEATGKQYEMINKYLTEEKNTLGETFEL
ncbi:hypothetical protein AB9K26_00725 [Psychroserpens sp. XS_ASV72]|uniref:hypothetical protein n=1 Tax=Psychroserpens sp. XS_ASV72 TaxID=3241293 RepID=UPI00351675EA